MDVRNVLVIIILTQSSTGFWIITFDYFSTGVVFISGTVGALPVAFMAEILTLRTCVIAGLVTSIVGCVIKNCAIQSNLYWLLFTGQLISQFSWVFVSAFGGRLANLWCLKEGFQKLFDSNHWSIASIWRHPIKERNCIGKCSGNRWECSWYGSWICCPLTHRNWF